MSGPPASSDMQEPVSQGQLLESFTAGCKPREEWKLGTEHEKIGFCLDSLRPIPYEGERSIHRTLELLVTDGWELEFEAGNPIALKRGMASITLEPGGQLELSGAPLATVHETCGELADHLALLQHVRRDLRIGFLGLGFQPKWGRDDIPWMPKGRYAVMRRYMPQVGRHGLDMMLRTATIQVNLDFSDEADMVRKMRVGYCLQPLVTAMFAASPFSDGAPSGYLSTRAAAWLDTDPARTGVPAMIFEADFGFERYMNWLLDVPMYFVIRDGRYVDCAGQSFRDFMQGKLAALPGARPTMDDWELHMTTVYPEVRLKRYMEMRGADAGGMPWICALPALWKGLLYDTKSLDAAMALVADWTHAEVLAMRRAVPVQGLATPFRDTTLLQLAEKVLDISRAGLERVAQHNIYGQDESIHLTPVLRAVQSNWTQAEAMLQEYHEHWQQRIEPLFQYAALP